MVESTKKTKEFTLENEYNEIMKGFQYTSIPSQSVPQWSNPNDFIVKFSLYQESPGSITSTETSANLTNY
jgi:hypothetical protein